ncbi:MAG: hypothetical protein ACRBDL_00825 [Alphaproteobacteria bacterium]
MTTILPLDANHVPLPALRLKDNGAHSVSASTTSQRNTTSFDTQTQIISLYATGPVYIRFGASDVTATSSDHYFPEGIYYDFSVSGKEQLTHVAVIRANYDCDVFISEKC